MKHTVSLGIALLFVMSLHADQALIDRSGISGGLLVRIGAHDARELATPQITNRFVVHVLDTDATKVAAARAACKGELYGRVSADTFDGRSLPYAENLVNLFIADTRGDIPDAEIRRVLAPGGIAFIEGDRLLKPTPSNTDEWTHYLHGPDNNAVASDAMVGPPRHLQWVGPPRWTRDHHILNSVSSVVTAGGRLFFILDEATGRDLNAPGEWALIARDAYNGIDLWRVPMGSWAHHRFRFRSGPPQLPRLLVASKQHVYAPLGLSEPVSQLDARSGDVLRTFEATTGAEEILLLDGTLLVLKSAPVATHAAKHPKFKGVYAQPRNKAIVSVDTRTGKTQWSMPLVGSVRAETLAADDGNVFVQVDQQVICLDRASGKERWRHGEAANAATAVPTKKPKTRKPPGLSFGTHVLVVSDGVVLCRLGAELVAIDAERGERLWSTKGGQGFHAPLDVFVIDGSVWTGSHPSDSTAPPPVADFSVQRDLKTGKVLSRNSTMVDLQSAGHHHRCYRNKASTHYIISGKRGVEMLHVTGDNHSRDNWIRGTCQYGIMPANGLVYAPPHSCGCYPESMVRGFHAMAARRSRELEYRSRAAERGPAYGKTDGAVAALTDAAWPTLRGDARRTGTVATELPGSPSQAWTTSIGGQLSQPVVAGDMLLVSAVDRHAVYALDAKSGKERWSRTVGGRVDSPPTIHQGLCLFGCTDGYVYCLRLRDGALVWRFLAARTDRRTIAWGQLESLWPVHGSVLIQNGLAYVSAGRSTWFDHGIDLYALSPETGEVAHHTQFETKPPKFGKGKRDEQLTARAEEFKKSILAKTARGSSRADYKTFAQSDRSVSFSMAGGTISDVLVSDGSDVFMHQVRFNSRLERQAERARHLMATGGFLHDPSEESRLHWVVGDGDFSQYPLPYPRYVGTGEKNPACGLILAYTADTAWAILRARRYSKVFDCNLVAFDLKNNAQAWQAPLGKFIARSILKAGDRLIVCGIQNGKSVLQLHVAANGKLQATVPLAQPPVWDGVAAAHGRLYLAMADGRITCLE